MQQRDLPVKRKRKLLRERGGERGEEERGGDEKRRGEERREEERGESADRNNARSNRAGHCGEIVQP